MNNDCVTSLIFINVSQYFGEKQISKKYTVKVMKKDQNEQMNKEHLISLPSLILRNVCSDSLGFWK